MGDPVKRATQQQSGDLQDQGPLAPTDQPHSTDAVDPHPAGVRRGVEFASGDARFTLLSPHAEGGLGRIHLARDEQLCRTVALKEIRPEHADDPRVRQRFLTEAEITGQLEHPGIVPIYALERDRDGRPVYAMRLIQGRTLSEAIDAYHQQPTTLGLRELLQRFIAVCQTVAYAHSKQVIHRDLKPGNIMLGDYGETLVVDWGLAKRLNCAEAAATKAAPETAASPAEPRLSEPESTVDYVWTESTDGEQLTMAGQVLGTPAYMAPEQARGEALGRAADIYALGAVLYKVLAGTSPYEGRNALAVVEQVLTGPPPTPLEARGFVPRGLNAICVKAMARNAGDRYATATDLAHDVENWLADEPIAAYREPLAARLGRWSRRHRSLVASLSVAAVLLMVVGLGVAAWQSQLTEQRRFEQAQNVQQIQALLDRCEAALAADHAAAAQLAIGDAEQRARNLTTDELNNRLARCRLATDMLVDLNRIDDLRWSTEEGEFRRDLSVPRWKEAFARLGMITGQTSPEAAAEVVNASLVRERLLAALDLWLIVAPVEEKAALASVLAKADPHPFRDKFRSGVQRMDWEVVSSLAAQDEALRQPAGFATALASNTALPQDRKLAVLKAAAQARPQAYAVLVAAGALLDEGGSNTAAERVGWYRSAVAVRPDNASVHNALGLALAQQGDPEGARAEFHTSISLDPKYTAPYIALAEMLKGKRDLDGMIALYRTAIDKNPTDAMSHDRLATALRAKGDLEGALAECRTAISVDPQYAPSFVNLAHMLRGMGDRAGAIAAFRQSLAIRPNAINQHSLGTLLVEEGDLQAAIACFREAVRLNPKLDLAYQDLGLRLQEVGDLDGAAAAYQETLRLNPDRIISKQNLPNVERWRVLLPRVDGVAAGREEPATPAEAADFCGLLQQPFQKRYAAAARLYQKACAADAKYAKTPGTTPRRLVAACAAAAAGCGQGVDAPTDPAACAALRAQALDWMQPNHRALIRRLDTGLDTEKNIVAHQLAIWRANPNLAGTLPGAKREGWSADETLAWNAFWSDVDATHERATSPSSASVVTPADGPGASRPAPPAAIAPFDARQARAHQEAWARHLGTEIATTNSVDMKMILIPPGEFLMGSTDEQINAAVKAAEDFKFPGAKGRIEKEGPQHKVVITKPFLMSSTETTLGQFKRFVEASKYVTEAEQYGFGDSPGKVLDDKITDAQKQMNWRTPGHAVADDSPVSQITWNDAAAYCRWLSAQEKQFYRLPTEAEWEYACRAGTTTQYSFGDDHNDLPRYGWHNKNAGHTSHPVAALSPNPFGLFDMHGNVYEWCGDLYDQQWYEKSSPNDPIGPPAGSNRVLRGGNWFHHASHCRSAFRFNFDPSSRYKFGFRCVAELNVTGVRRGLP